MKVDHPNIIKLHQCFHDSKNLYFLMDLVENGELFKYMKNQGTLDYTIAQFLAAQIVDIIAYLQGQSICHRDIKPGNILFDSRMHLKLIDFGSGKVYKDNMIEKVEDNTDNQSGEGTQKDFHRTNTFVGTYEYMAPEVIQGKYVGNSCDLWSLGIIIYKFFAEFAPFIGEFDQDTLDKIWTEPVKFPENFPENAQDLVSRLLEKDPLKRLGAGPTGSENDIFSLKSHPFFEGIDFDTLASQTSPIPIPIKRLASLKKQIIDKYQKTESEEIKVEEKAPIIQFRSVEIIEPKPDPSRMHKDIIDNWRYEKNIKITHRELIKVSH